MADKINIKNKKARFEYSFVDKFVAGIQLRGSEIKSLRDAKASITEAYCLFIGKTVKGIPDLVVRGMHIAEFPQASYNNHEPKRDRKLLLNKNELEKLKAKISQKGLTIVPIRLFINAKGLAKLEIALAQGKKLYDKRHDLKAKDDKRSMDRAMKNF